MENKEKNNKLLSVRMWMSMQGVEALIIFTSDPHNGEYIPDYWKLREYLCEFTGSAGTLVITHEEALLWTDSRYHIQAEAQLDATHFTLMKEGLSGVPSIGEWLTENMEEGVAVAVIGEQVSVAELNSIKQEAQHLEWQCHDDPFNELWPERPQLPTGLLSMQAAEHTEMSASQKIALVFSEVKNQVGATHFLMNDLAEIAWMLNLRGSDVEYNPVFLSYLLIGEEENILFIDKQKLTPEISDYLAAEKVSIAPYSALEIFIAPLSRYETRVALPPSANCATVAMMQNEKVQHTFINASPAELMKAVKCEAEIKGMREAMLQDGVAMVQFLRWLEATIKVEKVTEIKAEKALTQFRSQRPGFEQPSFATIAAYGAHGAIVHYEAEPHTDIPLRPESLFLLDSGGQYAGGTTDITRTLALGTLTEEERRAYTLVLKGHIALSNCRFPEGSTGLQLDLAARYAMWQQGYDFGHGTGHGVGAHLCVHEGPMQIRKNLRACTLVPLTEGMIITNEPGIYVEGKFGVRIENTLLVRRSLNTPFGRFLEFEPLTLCPIDLRPVHLSWLTADEREWLNTYHRQVREALMPLLTDEADRQWLTAATREVPIA